MVKTETAALEWLFMLSEGVFIGYVPWMNDNYQCSIVFNKVGFFI